MVLLLVVESHAEVLLVVVSLSNSLVALNHLEVGIAVQRDISVEALRKAIDCSNELITVLVHETQVQNDRGGIGMIIAAHHLQDALGSVQILEALGPVAALVVIETQVRVAVSQLRVIIPKYFLLNNDALGLQLNGLQEVSHFILYVRHLCDTLSDFWVHSTRDLKKQVYNLVVEIKSLLKLAIVAGSHCLLHHLGSILILIV